jgi:hypothetical protein
MGFGRRRAMRKWSRGSTLSSERTRRMRICRRLSLSYSKRNACRKTTPRAVSYRLTVFMYVCADGLGCDNMTAILIVF